VTESDPAFATNAVRPFGVMTMAEGSSPTLIAFEGSSVVVLIGVTLPDPLLTT
jgi:hypothetical protein